MTTGYISVNITEISEKRVQQRGLIVTIICILLLVFVAFMVSLPSSPSLFEQGRDSGQFALMAQMINDGNVAYRDFWHDKTPGTYYIQSVAFRVFGANRWVIWGTQSFWLFVTSVTVFLALHSMIGRGWAVAAGAVVALIARMPYFSEFGDMLSEGYTLLPQAIVFFLGVSFFQQPTKIKAFGIGIASAMIFLIRQNAISFSLGLVPALIFAAPHFIRDKQVWLHIGLMIIGGISGLLLPIIYFASQGALSDFQLMSAYQIDHRVWRYGSDALGPLSGLMQHRTGAFGLVFLNPPLVIAAWLSMIGLVRSSVDEQNRRLRFIGAWVLMVIPLDLLLSNLSGTAFPHYYIAMAVSLGILLILCVYGVWYYPSNWMVSAPWLAYVIVFILWLVGFTRYDLPLYGLALVVLSAVLAFSKVHTRQLFKAVVLLASALGIVTLVLRFGESVNSNIADEWHQIPEPEPEAEYIAAHSDTSDRILVWGYKPSILFQANRLPPGRFTYHHPTVTPGYTDLIVPELISSMEAQQAPYIVDSAIREGSGIIPPLDAQQRAEWLNTGGRSDTGDLSVWFDWVNDHCTVEETFGENWIYKCEYE